MFSHSKNIGTKVNSPLEYVWSQQEHSGDCQIKLDGGQCKGDGEKESLLRGLCDENSKSKPNSYP